jgi:hypothetical protein
MLPANAYFLGRQENRSTRSDVVTTSQLALLPVHSWVRKLFCHTNAALSHESACCGTVNFAVGDPDPNFIPHLSCSRSTRSDP